MAPRQPRGIRAIVLDSIVFCARSWFGLSGNHEKDWMMSREALKVSQAMFPEYVGLRCIDWAVKMFDGQPVETRDITPTVSMTAENLEKFYPKKDGVWTPDLSAIAAIPTAAGKKKV